MKKLLGIVVLGLLWCNNGFTSQIEFVYKKMFADFSQCNAYAATSEKINEIHNKDSDIIKKFKELNNNTLPHLYHYGTELGMTDDQMLEELYRLMNEMKTYVSNTYSRLLALDKEYKYLCFSITNQNHELREEHWKQIYKQQNQ
tara:strand:+ start:531 stop:962 length:432 start_codon:yes stop_codon:yes gene_type:complete